MKNERVWHTHCFEMGRNVKGHKESIRGFAMKYGKNGLLGVVAIALVSVAGAFSTAQAAPKFGAGLNSLFFNNFENLYRPSGLCPPPVPGAPPICLPFDGANDPVGYQRVNPGIANNILVGDVFAGIFNVQNIEAGGLTTFFAGPNDQFTGYFAQEVAGIIPAGVDPSGRDHLILNSPGVDPFGRLVAGEMFQIYVDDAGATPFESNGTTFQDIMVATDGLLWATLGAGLLADNTDGYGYTHTDLGVPLNPADPEAFFALDLMNLGPAYNAGLLLAVNDVNENEVGGVGGLGITTQPCGPADFGVIACTDIVGTSEIEINPNAASPWLIRSNDPFELWKVPEPGTVALLGIGLLGIGFGWRRRSRSATPI